MHGLFDSLDQVTLDDVQAFLADAGEEGVTWEAKADDDEDRSRVDGAEPGRLGKNTIRKAVSGLANQIGGYLLIGARWDKKERHWLLPGVVIDHDEPQLWLHTVIDAGISPAPRYDIAVWKLDDQRAVALVEVEPVPEPPCMTSQGHVYERVSGETRRVTDPGQLDSLFGRGRSARKNAEERAMTSARELATALDLGDGHGAIVVGVAPVGRDTDDVSSRLFTQPFTAEIEEALRSLSPGPIRPDEAFPVMGQTAVTAQALYLAPLGPSDPFDTPFSERDVRQAWAVNARWDGAVAAGASFDSGDTAYVGIFDEVISPAWAAVLPLVTRLGGFGPARLAIVIVGAGPPEGHRGNSLLARLTRVVELQRAIDLNQVSEPQLGSIQREVQRSAGITTYEPASEGDL